MATRYLRRYEDRDRMNHWFIALLFVLAGLSGLAFFHPSLFFFTHLFGGGPWTRILHPFMGLLMVLAFLGLFVRLWKENVMTDADREWSKHMGEMLRGNQANLPPVLAPVLQHGIFFERTGDILTDTFRASLLRIMGYRTDVTEFVPIEHTGRNLMIRAVRTAPVGEARWVAEYQALKSFWGLKPYLEQILDEPARAHLK